MSDASRAKAASEGLRDGERCYDKMASGAMFVPEETYCPPSTGGDDKKTYDEGYKIGRSPEHNRR